MNAQPGAELRHQFGGIDIYLFDQLLKGNFDGRTSVLDAGCGHGRNLVYFLRAGFTCYGIDRDADAIAQVRRLARNLGVADPDERFQQGELERLPWPDGSMDAVICSAVLHFARDRAQFDAAVLELWRVLAPEGLFFARLASSIGLEAKLPATQGRLRLPDGSDRFIVDEQQLLDTTARLGADLLDPIKTTNVQNQRCMTTWVLRKRGAPA